MANTVLLESRKITSPFSMQSAAFRAILAFASRSVCWRASKDMTSFPPSSKMAPPYVLRSRPERSNLSKSRRIEVSLIKKSRLSSATLAALVLFQIIQDGLLPL